MGMALRKIVNENVSNEWTELKQFIGKEVLITVADFTQDNYENKLNVFFSLIGSIDIDSSELNELRRASMI